VATAARRLAQGHLATTATWEAFAVLVPLRTISVTWATRTYRSALA
jgi:GMP synthase PP-ATPase subunit